MTTDHLDDDENVKALRETVASIGLTALLVKASQTAADDATQILVEQALRLLDVRETEGEAS